MKMRLVLSLAASVMAASAAVAADLPGYSPRADYSPDRCPAWGDSRIATLPTQADMSAQLNTLYATAVAETQDERTINNRSNRYVWAMAARNACGIAVGYISTGEVNSERFWNCECYSYWMHQQGR